MDLPQPDSPTMPSVSPGMSLSVRPRRACTLLGCSSDPVRVLNVTFTSSRKMMGVSSVDETLAALAAGNLDVAHLLQHLQSRTASMPSLLSSLSGSSA